MTIHVSSNACWSVVVRYSHVAGRRHDLQRSDQAKNTAKRCMLHVRVSGAYAGGTSDAISVYKRLGGIRKKICVKVEYIYYILKVMLE